MPPGQIARKLLGPAFQPVGEFYRRIFVDMPKIVEWLAAQIPNDARVLDIGGGDGYVIELLLNLRSDIHVTMTDTSSIIGAFISAKNRSRTVLMPATDIREVQGSFDVLMLADVVHHVPTQMREAFFVALDAAAQRTGAKTILIKDLRPSGIRAALGLFSDRYITGDKFVSFMREAEISVPDFSVTQSAMPDFPNYCLRFDHVSAVD